MGAIGQRDHAENFAGIHIQNNAASGAGAEFRAALLDLLRQRILHAHIDGQTHALAGMAVAQALVEAKLKTGNAVAVGIRGADDPARGMPLRVIALIGRIKFETGKTEPHHPVLRVGRDLARDQHIGMLRLENAVEAGFAGASRLRQFLCSLRLVSEIFGLHIEIVHRQIARQKLAIAIQQIGARGQRIGGGRGDKPRYAAVQEHHIDEANAHQREGGHAQNCGDGNPPLHDGGRRRHVHPG